MKNCDLLNTIAMGRKKGMMESKGKRKMVQLLVVSDG